MQNPRPWQLEHLSSQTRYAASWPPPKRTEFTSIPLNLISFSNLHHDPSTTSNVINFDHKQIQWRMHNSASPRLNSLLNLLSLCLQSMHNTILMYQILSSKTDRPPFRPLTCSTTRVVNYTSKATINSAIFVLFRLIRHRLWKCLAYLWLRSNLSNAWYQLLAT